MGIMEEIKQHLESGKTVKELKELGFKAPSIYKVKKQMKDNQENDISNLGDNDPGKIKEPPVKTKPFQEEVEEVPGTILDSTPTVSDHNNSGLDNPNTNSSNIPNTQEETKENDGLIQELFGDDKSPFRDFNEVDINRTHVDISSASDLSKLETKTANLGDEKLGLSELITQIYGTIAAATDHEHWELTGKDQKVLKHLCKIPALEKVLHKFGLYGCVLSLITMTFKRIKIEMNLKREYDEKEDRGNRSEPVIRPDSPGTVMELFE